LASLRGISALATDFLREVNSMLTVGPFYNIGQQVDRVPCKD
jgi:hypothetical protein